MHTNTKAVLLHVSDATSHAWSEPIGILEDVDVDIMTRKGQKAIAPIDYKMPKNAVM